MFGASIPPVFASGAAGVVRGAEVGACNFTNNPLDVGYFWDPACAMGKLGCNADGQNMQCRLCGAGDFSSIPCPASSCKFPNDPFVSYYWDTDCEMGKLGCWADGLHAQCRFCGDYPYTSIPCPEGAAPPNAAACNFRGNLPETPHYWEPGCTMGMHGCNADGTNVNCRYCGADGFSDIPCPAEQVCQFKQTPTVPYFWDPECTEGMLGCKADGVNVQCRFCATRPFEDVACPDYVAPPENTCTWPMRGEPRIPYFWDPTCRKGMLGCWADGLHAECRFCGEEDYEEVACPTTTTVLEPETQSETLLQQSPGQGAAAGSSGAGQATESSSASGQARPSAGRQGAGQATERDIAPGQVNLKAAAARSGQHNDWEDEDLLSGAAASAPLVATGLLVVASLACGRWS